MRKRKRKLRAGIVIGIACAACGTGIVAWAVISRMDNKKGWEQPEELLVQYMERLSRKEYEQMYAMLDSDSVAALAKDEYIKRNSNIYEGIEMENLKIEQVKREEGAEGLLTVSYHTAMDTVAGEISFENSAQFIEGEEGYQLLWKDGLIFPELEATDKVTVSVDSAERGEILDRSGAVLAGKGTASSVGIVPGKLEDKQASIEKIAELLEVSAESVEQKLQAEWVRDDSFVPVKTIPKVQEASVTEGEQSEEEILEQERQQQLLAISGVMITDIEVREYPLGEAAAHLVGYVQSVTAEDLEEHEGEGYSATSVIGRSGMEGLYEKELKGEDGHEISIVDEEGTKKQVLALEVKQDGEDIKLTIDASLQQQLYEQFQEDQSCSVAMNPNTGEVLALVSTPTYDNNDFIMGMSDEKWSSLNEDERMPLYNRFRQLWCPGSTFKPVTAAIGLETGTVDPEEDFGNEGLSWQKDSSWGDYYVTTLHAYEPVTMENALIYSDNIYFAKAALRIGAKKLAACLDNLGFGQDLPFEIVMERSQYSNTDAIETEIQLADSGYGQGEILVNPLHLASLYTSFVNGGNAIKPYLQYQESPGAEVWIPEAFSSETAAFILEAMKKVVNDPNGTGYGAHREDIVLAGKTGTAEIKVSQEDKEGTELGWFAVLTPEADVESSILIVSMVENVKDIGGSGYVVEKDRAVLDAWLQ